MLTCRFVFSAIAILCSVGGVRAEPVDLVRVDKSERRLELMSAGKVVRSYAMALGANPEGH